MRKSSFDASVASGVTSFDHASEAGPHGHHHQHQQHVADRASQMLMQAHQHASVNMGRQPIPGLTGPGGLQKGVQVLGNTNEWVVHGLQVVHKYAGGCSMWLLFQCQASRGLCMWACVMVSCKVYAA